MATTKKFLDLTGLEYYNGKIKDYADNAAKTEAGKVNTGIRQDYKVKDVDTTDNGKVALTLNTDTGVLGVTVDADVVKDSEYFTKVKVNANNSAAAWTKFLDGLDVAYPDGITPGLKDLATTSNLATAKSELIGGELDTKNSNSIKGAKLYADDLASGLSTRIDDLVAGGVEFKGVVTELPSPASDGDLIIMGADVKVGDITYKKDYEYIYSKGAWYELGDSDKNAKAIAAVESKANANAIAISNMDTAYKAADSALSQSIDTVSKAAVKSIAVTDNSDYVTVEASIKGDDGKVTLTVSDSIAATFDTQASVDGKISTAKTEVSEALIGKDNDEATASTIKGAKKYADEAVKALDNSFERITNDDIDGLFTPAK